MGGNDFTDDQLESELLTTDWWREKNVKQRARIEEFHREGVDDEALAARLQREGVEAFAVSWHALLTRIREKCAMPAPRV